MKSILRTLVTVFVFFSINAKAEEHYSFGFGLGALYGGLGANVSIVSDNDMKYFSGGCISYSTANGPACGVGVGWVKTDLFETNSNKHGFGGYIGIIGSETENHNFIYDNKPVYGLGLGYYYFFHGIRNAGFNLGLTLVSGNAKNGAMLQVGYQF